jgi:hypothetical protein
MDALHNTVGRDWLLPFVDGYNLFNLGLGPLTLIDTYRRSLEHIPQISVRFWWWATLIGVAGGAAIIYLVVATALELIRDGGRRLWRTSDALPAGILLAFTAAYGAVMLFELNYDRYLIPLFPALALVATFGIGRLPRARPRPGGRPGILPILALSTAGVFALLFGFFSVAATRDYLAWNRARWKALDDLTKVHKVPADRIDGGFEWNGTIQHETKFEFTPTFAADKSWWWVTDDEYRVTFGDMPGYQTFGKYKFERWLPPGAGAGYIHVIKRQP